MGTNSKELYWESFKKIEKIVEFPKSKPFIWEFHKERQMKQNKMFLKNFGIPQKVDLFWKN